MKELVSVIVPCYNQGEFISETLESVYRQTYDNWECVVIDDGSTDDSKIIALSYCEKDRRFRYIFQENAGVSNARNNGIQQSSGKYILPLDADDVIAESYLEEAVNYMEDHPSCKLFYCHAAKFGAEQGPWELAPYVYGDLLWDNMIFVSAVFRKEDFLKTSGYNPNMKTGLEDWDFWLSFLNPEDEVFCSEKILFYYRIKHSSRNTEMRKEQRLLHRQMVKNHPKMYAPYMEDIIYYHNLSRWSVRKLDSIQHSFSYKLARLIMAPKRCFDKLLH